MNEEHGSPIVANPFDFILRTDRTALMNPILGWGQAAR